MTARRQKRLVEHIRSDPFIDVAFVYPLINRSDWLHVLERQAVVFTSTGDIGENTVTYRRYKNEIRSFIVNTFKHIYEKTIESQLKADLVEDKARRAWKALITLLASRSLMESIGLGLGELLPKKYADLTSISPVIEKIIEVKTRSKGVSGASAIKKALVELGIDREGLSDIAPLLWWINLVMESEVFEAVFKFHYLVHSKIQEIRFFAREIENSLLIFRNHEPDYEYAEYEILRALLSRCAELRSQYINKLHNAILFVKYLRQSVKEPERWEWFVYDEILTYVASIYMVEMQRLSGVEKMLLNVSGIIGLRKGLYAGAASALASLILLSPIFMQYAVEARSTAVVTPSDIIVSVLRLINKQNRMNDFAVDIHEVAGEIVEFWKESDILRRLRIYSQGKITAEALYRSRSFTVSLALLINAGVEGIHISTMRRPILKLPPRMIGYDSLFIRPRRLLFIIKKVWEV